MTINHDAQIQDLPTSNIPVDFPIMTSQNIRGENDL